MRLFSARPIKLLMAVLLVWPWLALSAYAEDARRIGKSAVFAVPPPNFTEVSQFPGLVNTLLGGSIVVIEQPKETFVPMLAFFASADAFNKKFSQGGIVVREIETGKTVNGLSFRLAHGTHTDVNGVFDKWIAIYSGEVTEFVTFQVLERNKLAPEVVKAFFQSVTIGTPPAESEVLSNLSFDLAVEPPFRLGSNVGTAGVLLVGGPDRLNSRNDQPMILVFHGPNPIPARALDIAAAVALRSTSTLRKASILTRKDISFAGLPGVEFQGITLVNGLNLVFTQRFVRGPDGMPLRMVVFGPEDAVLQVQPQIERIFSSIKIKPKT